MSSLHTQLQFIWDHDVHASTSLSLRSARTGFACNFLSFLRSPWACRRAPLWHGTLGKPYKLIRAVVAAASPKPSCPLSLYLREGSVYLLPSGCLFFLLASLRFLRSQPTLLLLLPSSCFPLLSSVPLPLPAAVLLRLSAAPRLSLSALLLPCAGVLPLPAVLSARRLPNVRSIALSVSMRRAIFVIVGLLRKIRPVAKPLDSRTQNFRTQNPAASATGRNESRRRRGGSQGNPSGGRMPGRVAGGCPTSRRAGHGWCG